MAELIALAVAARKTTPLSGRSMSPVSIITGRGDDFLTRLRNIPPVSPSVHPPLKSMRDHLRKILQMREDIALWGAKKSIALALRRPLRAGAQNTYIPLDTAQSWGDKQEIWQNGFRLLTETGRSAIGERWQRAVKIPKLRIRPRRVVDSDIIVDAPPGNGFYPPPSVPIDSSTTDTPSTDAQPLVVPLRFQKLHYLP